MKRNEARPGSAGCSPSKVGRLRQNDSRFKSSLNNLARPYFKKIKRGFELVGHRGLA